jgi:AcrR family transcriptional regulator
MPRAGRKGWTRRRTYHHGNLRRSLLDEALVTIRDEGVGAVTLREIGARLGVSRTALYRHFADKRALLAAVATEGFRMLREQLREAWEMGRDPAAFDAMGNAYVRFAVDNPAHYRVMFGGYLETKAEGSELSQEAAGAFQSLADALAELQGRGLVRGDELVLMARFVWAVVHGVALLCIDTGVRKAEEIHELVNYAVERIHTGIDRLP